MKGKGKENSKKARQERKIVARVQRKWRLIDNRLPEQILQEIILSRIQYVDKESARLVCKRFNGLMFADIRLNIPLTNSTLAEFKTLGYKINELKVVMNQVTIPEELPPKMATGLESAQSLYFMAKAYAGRQRRAGYVGVDGDGVERLLQACNEIKTLRFDFRHMETYLDTGELDWSRVKLEQLSTLQVKLAVGGTPQLAIAILGLETPCLKTLEVESFCWTSTYKYEEADETYRPVVNCIDRNKGTLRELKLVNLSGLIVTPNQFADMNLEAFEIHHNKTFISGYWPAIRQLVSNLRALKTLVVNTDSDLVMELCYDLLRQNSECLSTLEIKVQDPAEPLKIKLLTGLTSLTNLSLSSSKYKFVVFPNTLQHLTWNTPINQQWFLTCPSSNLLSLTLGPLAYGTYTMELNELCERIFGIVNEAEKTTLQEIILQRESAKKADWNRVLKRISALPIDKYKVLHDKESARVTRILK